MLHLIMWNIPAYTQECMMMTSLLNDALLIQYVCIQYTSTSACSVQHLPPALPPAVPVVRVTLRFWCSMGSRDCSVCSNLGRLMSPPPPSPPPSPLPSPPPPPPIWGVLLLPQPPLAIFSGVIGGSLHWMVESLRSLHLSRLYILPNLPVPSDCFNLDGTIGWRNLVLRS